MTPQLLSRIRAAMFPRDPQSLLRRSLAGLLLLAAGAWPATALAQTDEIQVYTGELVAPGEFTLTLHNNYTFDGAKTPAFPGAVVADGSLNGVPEWAYGVNDWLELGAYFAVYSRTRDAHYVSDSAKLRATFAVPHAEKRNFFYGVNFELSHNAHRWDEKRTTGEIRPIVGWRMGSVDLITNPILDTAFDGLGQLDFAPATRLAWNASSKWAFAVEHYADFGTLRHLAPSSRQEHALFAVVDYDGKPGVEFGIGHGLNGSTDKLVVKLMLNWSLNR
jgi:hypothetical protein